MPKKINYSKELLEPLAMTSNSITEIIIKLGLVPKGGSYKTIKNNIAKFDIDVSHFTGQGWSKGLTKETSESVMKTAIKTRKHTVNTSLKENVKVSSYRLRNLAIEAGLEYKCQICGQNDNWNNIKLVLPLDHINGINTDNKITNLRFLCPNCHTQTETFCCKNLSYQKSLVRATGLEPA